MESITRAPTTATRSSSPPRVFSCSQIESEPILTFLRNRVVGKKRRKEEKHSGEEFEPERRASQLAHTSLVERPRGVRRGPRTGNLLLYTRPEIRMYHSRTHVCAVEHVRPVGGLIRTRPDRERRWEARHLHDETRFTTEDLRLSYP